MYKDISELLRLSGLSPVVESKSCNCGDDCADDCKCDCHKKDKTNEALGIVEYGEEKSEAELAAENSRVGESGIEEDGLEVDTNGQDDQNAESPFTGDTTDMHVGDDATATTDLGTSEVPEGGMPSTVVKLKQKLSSMSQEELKDRFERLAQRKDYVRQGMSAVELARAQEKRHAVNPGTYSSWAIGEESELDKRETDTVALKHRLSNMSASELEAHFSELAATDGIRGSDPAEIARQTEEKHGVSPGSYSTWETEEGIQDEMGDDVGRMRELAGIEEDEPEADEFDTNPDAMVDIGDAEPGMGDFAVPDEEPGGMGGLGQGDNIDQMIDDIASFTDKYDIEKLYNMPYDVIARIHSKYMGEMESKEVNRLKELAGLPLDEDEPEADEFDTNPDAMVDIGDAEPGMGDFAVPDEEPGGMGGLGQGDDVDQMIDDIASFTDKYDIEKLYNMPYDVIARIHSKFVNESDIPVVPDAAPGPDGAEPQQIFFVITDPSMLDRVMQQYGGNIGQAGDYMHTDQETMGSIQDFGACEGCMPESIQVVNQEGDLNNGYGTSKATDGGDYFPTGADVNVAADAGPASGDSGDNPLQKRDFNDVTDHEEVRESLTAELAAFKKKTLDEAEVDTGKIKSEIARLQDYIEKINKNLKYADGRAYSQDLDRIQDAKRKIFRWEEMLDTRSPEEKEAEEAEKLKRIQQANIERNERNKQAAKKRDAQIRAQFDARNK